MTEALSVSQLTVSAASRTLLEDVSLTVYACSTLAVIGPNGAGKSTLLKALVKLVKINSGTCRVLGQDIATLSQRDLARSVAYVAQRGTPLYPCTVYELVAMGRFPHTLGAALTKRDQELIERAIAATDLAALRQQSVLTLSGGELQRAYLAVALAQEPRLLLLDEPTSSLDPGQELTVLEMVRQYQRENGLTVVWVTHDLPLAVEWSDAVLALKEGRSVFSGTAQELDKSGVLQSLYSRPVHVQAGGAASYASHSANASTYASHSSPLHHPPLHREMK